MARWLWPPPAMINSNSRPVLRDRRHARNPVSPGFDFLTLLCEGLAAMMVFVGQKGAHSGWLSARPAIRYGVSNPSYMRWAIMPCAACLRLWQWSIQMPGLFATKATS